LFAHVPKVMAAMYDLRPMTGAPTSGNDMFMGLSAYSLFRLAGLVICLVSGATTLASLWFVGTGAENLAGIFPGKLLVAIAGPLDADTLRRAIDVWFAIAALSVGCFAWMFLWITRPGQRPTRLVVAALVAQAGLGLFVSRDFLVLTSMELPFLFSARAGAIWLAIQETLFCVTSLSVAASMASATTIEKTSQIVHLSWSGIMLLQILSTLTGVGWHAFAFCAGFLATSEQRGRIRLVSANAELHATQHLLAEGVRTAERLRIARDLHDAMGHHLMALSLHLEIAARAVAGHGQQAIAVAKEVSQRLTEELRETVGMMRKDQPIDLRGTLDTLCAGIPAPPVWLIYDDDVRISDVAQASLIFHSVQEGLSNAVRHAAAREIIVQVNKDRQGIVVIVRDDGCGGAGLTPGNGLTGMRERVAMAGGRLDIVTSHGQGMALRLWLPSQRGGA
jgi:signal transduction histidine kinase